VMVTAGRPYYGRLADMDFTKIRDLIGAHLLQALYVARNAANKVRPGGTLIFMGGSLSAPASTGCEPQGRVVSVFLIRDFDTVFWLSQRHGHTSAVHAAACRCFVDERQLRCVRTPLRSMDLRWSC
jgi:hypothetical protein